MQIRIVEAGIDKLKEYSLIPISFEVKSIFKIELIENGLGGLILNEEICNHPYSVNFDGDTEGPTGWVKRFDLSNWGILLAITEKNEIVGGATIAYNTPGVLLLEERNDLAVLWDIRVSPNYRKDGIGSKLFEYTVKWAMKNGCKRLKVETQNTNVPACKFYAKQQCKIGIMDRYAYIDDPDCINETMLVWYKDL